MDIDARLKAIDMDIDQTKYLIEEQRNSTKVHKEKHEKKHDIILESDEDIEKKEKKHKIKENLESMLTSTEEPPTISTKEILKNIQPAATYPVDEKFHTCKSYECYVCMIF